MLLNAGWMAEFRRRATECLVLRALERAGWDIGTCQVYRLLPVWPVLVPSPEHGDG